ncbi:LOW QUALITY PROTEIN: centromere protein Q-like [Rhynchocyon petersi]
MADKENVYKKNSQQLKKKQKRKIDDEDVESDKKVRNTMTKNKQPKCLSSKVAGKTSHANFKQIQMTSKKRKGWQPLSKTSREYLQTMIDSIGITILSNTSKEKEKEQVHYHLNYLKKRLLQLCESLKAPSRKLKNLTLTNMASLLKVEKACHRANEGLASLQEEVEKTVENTELMTENIQSLKNKIQVLTTEVEEEEKKLKQVFEVDHSGVLGLPELPQDSLKAPILQNEILMEIPNHKALLKDLETLHNSSQMKSMMTLIEAAYNWILRKCFYELVLHNVYKFVRLLPYNHNTETGASLGIIP